MTETGNEKDGRDSRIKGRTIKRE